jgi:hypothetical protein
MSSNSQDLENELSWLAKLLEVRIRTYFGQEAGGDLFAEVPPPDLVARKSVYADILRHYNMGPAERAILILALAPHLRPQILDVFFTKNALYDRGFAEFGGIKGSNHGGFIPTGETAAFLLGGTDLDLRFVVVSLLDEDHFFQRFGILQPMEHERGEPMLSSPLTVSREYITYLTTGLAYKPPFSSAFPAQRLSTALEWEDVVLDEHVRAEVDDIRAWVEHGDTLLQDWGLGRRVKPGYRCLFYGPPGTGKTLTATLLGKASNREVYRIDLSRVVSKYIGETEKNLAGVFDQAMNKSWILFFDEADALFGKRTATKDSHDRYANQEVSYLLQRIEDFPGLVILATNLRGNLDDAFARRFQSMIFFSMPGPVQRLELWKRAFSDKTPLEEAIDLRQLAEEVEISGGAILNVVQYASLQAVKRGSTQILLRDLMTGIRREMMKEGKTGG